MGDQFSTLLVSLLTQDVQMVLLSLMVFSRKWSGTKYGAIVKFTSIDQTQRVYDRSRPGDDDDDETEMVSVGEDSFVITSRQRRID